jgi:hypothetical protein
MTAWKGHQPIAIIFTILLLLLLECDVTESLGTEAVAGSIALLPADR